MKTIISYPELSQITNGKFTFTRVSENSLKLSGEIKILLINKKISEILTIERVGFSSITFSSTNPGLISMGLNFIPSNFKKAFETIEDGHIKINLRAIPELKGLTETLKLTGISFMEEGVIIEITPRP